MGCPCAAAVHPANCEGVKGNSRLLREYPISKCVVQTRSQRSTQAQKRNVAFRAGKETRPIAEKVGVGRVQIGSRELVAQYRPPRCRDAKITGRAFNSGPCEDESVIRTTGLSIFCTVTAAGTSKPPICVNCGPALTLKSIRPEIRCPHINWITWLRSESPVEKRNCWYAYASAP